MPLLIQVLSISSTGVLLVAIMLLYLSSIPGSQDGAKQWSIGFFILASAYMALIFLSPHVAVSQMDYLNVTFYVIYSVFVVSGTIRHFNADQSILYWVIGCIGTIIWFSTFFLLTDYFLVSTIIPAVFLFATHFYTACLFYKSRKSAGELIVVFVSALLAIHYADYPFLRQIEWFAPIGFLIAGVLSILFACSLLYVKFNSFKSELIEAKELALKLAHSDSLTGLMNRRRLFESFDVLAGLAHRHKTKMVVVFIDLNDFKQINDTLGHEAGDVVLVKVARRLNDAVRESDVVARVGGDEFVILANDYATKHDIDDLLNRIRDRLRHSILLNQQKQHIEASIGYSLYPDDGETIEALLSQADKQMFDNKEQMKRSSDEP
ncbi:GGDEF domain-containing protein [Pleionea sediminis]|uniref:GGDEF domain-containing protein n=1 Tax=Pleionea sediminis TaxID=2569479 RepID=UPI0011871845|nr:GGDEF domain-containing protein [Pleionea sediminis]